MKGSADTPRSSGLVASPSVSVAMAFSIPFDRIAETRLGCDQGVMNPKPKGVGLQFLNAVGDERHRGDHGK